MRKNAPAYAVAGLPYGRGPARAIVQDVLATRVHAKRSELAALAYEKHVRKGGLDDGRDPVPPKKKALYDLEHCGAVAPLELYGY